MKALNWPQKLIIPLTLTIVFALLFPLLSFAQENKSGLDLTVSPSLLELNANPGDTVSEKVRIRNNSSSPLPLKVQIGKLAPSKDLSQIVPADPEFSDDYLKWVKVENASFNAPAQEWTDVPLTFTIPQTAAYGYYYAIRFSQTNLDPNNQGTAKIQGEVVVPVLLKVKKEGAKIEAQVIDFHASNSVYEYLPAEFTTQVKNVGNVHLKPRGSIFISGQGSKDLAILDFNAGLGNILPNSIRIFKTEWNDGFISWDPKIVDGKEVTGSDGQIERNLVVHWDKLTHFRFGPYQARLFLVYDDGQRDVVVEKQTNFWVIPYTIIGTTLVALLALIFIIRMMIKSYVKSQMKKYQR